MKVSWKHFEYMKAITKPGKKKKGGVERKVRQATWLHNCLHSDTCDFDDVIHQGEVVSDTKGYPLLKEGWVPLPPSKIRNYPTGDILYMCQINEITPFGGLYESSCLSLQTSIYFFLKKLRETSHGNDSMLQKARMSFSIARLLTEHAVLFPFSVASTLWQLVSSLLCIVALVCVDMCWLQVPPVQEVNSVNALNVAVPDVLVLFLRQKFPRS